MTLQKLRILDLFSGIGGFSLGLERTGGFETAAFCEIEPFPRRVLAKHWPGVPIHDDVRALKGSDIDGSIDVICGGYPCQPFSTAGKRAGKDDDRHLWPEFSRLVDELRPAWVIGENVAGHISMGLDDVLSDLEGKGYACRAFVIPACAKGAPHRRDRTWVVAHADGGRHDPADKRKLYQATGIEGAADNFSDEGRQIGAVAHAHGFNAQGQQPRVADTQDRGKSGKRQARPQDAGDGRQRLAESGMGGSDDGFPGWMDGSWERGIARVASGVPERAARLKALGNAVVPQIPEMIGRAILDAEAVARRPQ